MMMHEGLALPDVDEDSRARGRALWGRQIKLLESRLSARLSLAKVQNGVCLGRCAMRPRLVRRLCTGGCYFGTTGRRGSGAKLESPSRSETRWRGRELPYAIIEKQVDMRIRSGGQQKSVPEALV